MTLTFAERLDRIDAAMFGKRQQGLPISCNYCGLLVADRDVHRLWHMLGERIDVRLPIPEAEDYEAARAVLEGR